MKTFFFHSVPQRCSWDAGNLLPFRESSLFATPLDQFNRSPISGLFSLCGPSAVVRRIRPIVVFSVQRRSWRRLAHVGKKILKHFPPVANKYPTGAVMRVSLRPFIFAALAHPVPDIVHSRSGKPVAQVRRKLFGIAATGLSSTVNKVCALAGDVNSAGAFASPNGPAFWTPSNVLNGCEPAKLLASKIAQCHLGNGITSARCIGVWNRTKERHAKCVEAQG